MKRSKLEAALALALATLAGSAATFAALRAPGPVRAARSEPSSQPAGATAPTGASEKTQYDLARDVARARSAPAAQQSELLRKTRRDYAEQRFEWEAAYVPALCQRARRCFVAPFDHGRDQAPAQQGWLIELSLSVETHAELLRACAPHAGGVCVVRFEARLDKLVLQSDLPTAVGFADVAVHGARAARSSESWIRRTPR